MTSLLRPAILANGGARIGRDPRIDMLRGFALLTIFIDHVPDNPLNPFTMRNFGFCDAAELFVVLAGVSATMAYGKLFERDGAAAGIRRVFARCWKIYLFQIGLLLTTLAMVELWPDQSGQEQAPLALFFERPVAAMAHALALHALPASLNILPLYIVLLGVFPLIYLGMRTAPTLTLFTSGAVWLAANLDHALNLTNWLDGQGWFFNPFAWQFLFALGMLGAMVLRANGGELPRRRALVWASWAYLGFSLIAAAPWTAWGLSAWQPISLPTPDKTALSPLRLFDILALVYLALGSASLRRLAGAAWLRPMVACGKHSLEVFSFLTLVAQVFRLTFQTFGPLWSLQAAVNVAGVGAILALGVMMERQAGAAPRRPQVASVPS